MLKKLVSLAVVSMVSTAALGGGGGPNSAPTEIPDLVDFKPIESLTITASMKRDDKALVSGEFSSPGSAIKGVFVNGYPAQVYGNRFTAIVPEDDHQATVYVANHNGGVKEQNITLGGAIFTHIGRAVKHADSLRVRGYIESEGPVTSLRIAGHPVSVDGDNAFNAVLPYPGNNQEEVELVAENNTGGRDVLAINFSNYAPEHGVVLKLRESGMQGIGDVVKPIVDGLLPNLSGTVIGALDGLGDQGGDGFAHGSYDISNTRFSINPDSQIGLSPVASEQDGKAAIGTDLRIHQANVGFDLYAKGCVFWVICPDISLSLDAQVDGLLVGGNVMLEKGIMEPADNAVFAGLESALVLDVERISFPAVDGPLGDLVSLIVTTIARPILGNVASGAINNLINTEVGNLMNNTVPTRIPGLLVDNDNGVAETLSELGIFHLFKILARGIGLTLGVDNAFSTQQEAALALDLNLTHTSSDDQVRYGYVKRNLPNSLDTLRTIQPTQATDYDAVLVLDANMLNKTGSVFNQAQLMDFTIPSIDVNALSETPPALLQGKKIDMRVYSRDGSPYFSAPVNDGELLKVSMTDYVLELSIDGDTLAEVNVDIVAGTDLKIVDNRFSIPLLDSQVRIRGAKIAGVAVAETDTDIVRLIDTLGNLAASKVMKVLEVFPLPIVPGNKMISLSTWRVNRHSADIALAIRLDDASVVADNGSTTSGSTDGTSASGTDANAATGGIDLSNFDINGILSQVGGVFTQIGSDPLDSLPTETSDLGSPNTNRPHIPAINRQPIGIKNAHFTRSHMPDMRLSQDGRIGVGMFTADLALFKPELINQDEAFIPSETPQLIVDTDVSIADVLRNSPFTQGTPLQGGHMSQNALCDPGVAYLPEGRKQNPYACGVNGQDDCYDLSLVGYHALERDDTFEQLVPTLNQDQIKVAKSRFYSVPLNIRVTNPKTTQARIEEVKVTGPVKQTHDFSGTFFEMNVPMDGRLFVTRTSGRALTWYNKAQDRYVTANYDNVYGVIPEDAEPCDVSAITDLRPLTHAPYDDEMKRYKFAAYPFRDPFGELIPDGAESKGTYPWISRDGSMVAFSSIGISRLFPRKHVDPSDNRTRYPSRCLDSEPNCTIDTRADVQFRSLDTGIVMAGLWTQGKYVLIDSLINEIDFKLGLAKGDIEHSLVQLYEPNTGKLGNESGEIEVGETRSVTHRDKDGNLTHYGTRQGNGTVFDSPTNLLNFWPSVRPATLRDVVWTMNTGRQSDEVDFDDYLNPNGLIVSHMVGAMQYENNDEIEMTYYDGWNQAALDFVNPVRVQNSATALPEKLAIPQYGEVHFGRLEPTATGGVKGKGQWMDGVQTYISYAIPEQPVDVSKKPWFMNLFIDPRFGDDGLERMLVHYPDNTALTLRGSSEVLYKRNGEVVHSISLPAALESIHWTQIATQTRNEGREIAFYLNGYLYDQWNSSEPMFVPAEGQLDLAGRAPNQEAGIQPFKGWIDDFKLFAEVTNQEVICNHARGTLVGIPEDYSGYLYEQAEKYPATSHGFLSRTLKGYGRDTHNMYACFHNNTKDYGAHLLNIPGDVVSVRESLLFPEGPLFHDAPRPDSASNQFCLSCHHAQGQGGLGINALTKIPGLPAKLDPRRQPMQPPAKVGGVLPANWLPGSHGFASSTPDLGSYIDELLLDTAEHIVPTVKGLTLVDAETGIDIMPVEEGTVLDLASLPPRLALRFATNGVTQNVSYSINGDSGTIQAPFAPFGVDVDNYHERRFQAVEFNVGQYAVEAEAAGGADTLTLNFSVAGVAPEIVVVAPEVVVPVTEESILAEARNWLDAVIEFFSGLLDSVYETVFGHDELSDAEVAAAQTSSSSLHQQVWQQADNNHNEAIASAAADNYVAQLYFSEVGLCLAIDAPNGNTTYNNGYNIRMESCHEGANQLWFQSDAGEIRSAADTNKCIDAWNGELRIHDCHGGDNQKYRIDHLSYLRNANHCVASQYDTAASTSNAWMAACPATAGSQVFRAEWRQTELNSFVPIVNEGSKLCLSNVNNAHLRQEHCHANQDKQKWYYNRQTKLIHSRANPRLCAGRNKNVARCDLDTDQLQWDYVDGQFLTAGSRSHKLITWGNGHNWDADTVPVSWGGHSKWSIREPELLSIRNFTHDLCLTINGDNPVSGQQLVLWHCDAIPSRLWRYERDSGLVRSAIAPNMCLNMSDKSHSAVVNLRPCDAANWKQQMDYEAGRMLLRSDRSWGIYVAGGANAGNWARMAKIGAFTDQHWYMKGSHITQAKPYVVQHSGACLDLHNGQAHNGNNVVFNQCNGSRTQSWLYDSVLGAMRPASNPHKCLAFNHNALGNGTNIVIWDCHSADNSQRFDVLHDKTIRPRANHQFTIDAAGWGHGNGTNAYLYTRHDNWANQQFD